MSTGRCNMQTADYKQTMDCRVGTRGKMQCYFHYRVLTITRRNKPLFKLMRVKVSTLDSLNCNTITLNICRLPSITLWLVCLQLMFNNGNGIMEMVM